MVRLKWDNEDSPMYQAGVSQGVFYGDDGVGHAWSGLISVTEKPQNNAPTAVYNAMGQKYDIFGNVAEKKHGLACYIYPEVMDEYLGYEFLEEFGYIVDERPPKKFHMAYRVELGDGLYEIHVLLNQIATFGETARQTITSIIAPSTITMNLEGAVDPRIGTSHIVLDSRTPLTKTAEALLFGDRYNDSNINNFLEAEPVWETVGVNYAPIIEPDYDNMVWLGGENLIGDVWWYPDSNTNVRTEYTTSYVNDSNDSGYQVGRVYHNSDISDGEMLTIQIKGTTPEGRDRFRLFNNGGSTSLTNITLDHTGVYTATFEHKTDPSGSNFYLLYSGSSSTNANNNPGITHIDWIKIERGSTPTPWTPSPSDPDQKPRAIEPYPDNYRPGIKNSSEWVSNNGLIQVFYDEDRKGLGLYSKTTFESLNTYGDIYWDDITPHISINTIPSHRLGKRSVYATAKVSMVDPLSDLVSSRYATIGVGQHGPTADSPPNTRGESDLYVLNDTLKLPVGSDYDSIRLYHGGSSDTEVVTFTEILTAPLTQELKFFDVNSKPPAQGIRYQRVSTPNGDFTIRQDLRLRVK